MKAVLEHIPSASGSCFASFRRRTRCFNCSYHYHPEVELTLIRSGSGHRLIGDNLASFGPGDLVLIGANLPHSYFPGPDSQKEHKDAEAVVVQFPTGMAGGFLFQAPECRGIVKLLQRAERGLHFSPSLRASVDENLGSLSELNGPQRLARLLEILGELADRRAVPLSSGGFTPSLNVAQAERLERGCRWIADNFRSPITLGEVSRHVHMTPPAFSRFFRLATNRTFVHFVNELRVGYACRLLLESDRKVTEVAFESGFENLSNFNRRFRALRGRSPKEFRNLGKR